jgi:hypothetical protein
MRGGAGQMGRSVGATEARAGGFTVLTPGYTPGLTPGFTKF